MKRNLAVPATVAAVLVIVGFAAGSLSGGATPRAEPEAAIEPASQQGTTDSNVQTCSLLTEDEASATLGVEVSQVADPNQCTYVALDDTARTLAVSLPAMPATRKEFEAGVNHAAQALEGDYQQISAGDEAYAITASMLAEGLARVGDRFVVVVLTSPTGSQSEQVQSVEGLLQTAVGRL